MLALVRRMALEQCIYKNLRQGFKMSSCIYQAKRAVVLLTMLMKSKEGSKTGVHVYFIPDAMCPTDIIFYSG